jgi:leader peptidase (prepilin peptidase) / N-methyltransferase
MHVIGIAVAIGLGAAALGWWFRASRLAARWAQLAAGPGPCRCQKLPVFIWPLATGGAASLVFCALLPGGHRRFLAGAFAPWASASLVVWACGLSLLALTDRERLVLPSKLVRTCAVATAGLVLAGCAVSGEWRYLWPGALCAVIAGAVFALWALLRPHQLGFGDVRMAALVAFGAGICSPAGCLVALACAPFSAAVVSNFALKAKKNTLPSPVALGPYLAVAGIAVVVGCAF